MLRDTFKNLYSTLSKWAVRAMNRAKLTEHIFIIVIAIIIGILAGFAGIGIRFLIEGVSKLSFSGNSNVLENIINSPWYVKLFVPLIGGLIVGPIIYFFAREAKGHGVPEVMEAILLRGGSIRPRVAFVKSLASAISIGTGGSVGREGPIIQIGASLGSTVGQFFRIPSKRLKTLVGCGAAAGIAAAFNAPIAGALFAVEIILMDFAVAQFSPIVISSVMATVVSRSFEGDLAAFSVPTYQLQSPYEITLYFALGAITGLVSFLFIKALYASEDLFDNKINMPEYLKPAVGGLGMGLLAFVFPHTLGVGYDTINEALNGDLVWHFAFILIFVKIFATSLTLGSGGSGGIFAPSLFMGATLGAFFGELMNMAFPGAIGSPGAYALVAMGGLVAGTTRAPITAIIIVFELTLDYHIILPLMITCIISTILSSKLSRESIYTLKLLLRNVSIREGREINIMESIYVNEVYTKDFISINVDDNFSKVVNKVLSGRGGLFPVVNHNGEIYGTLSINTIREYLFEREELKNILIAGDIAQIDYDYVTPLNNCQDALDYMQNRDLEGIPVVEDEDSKKLVGMLWMYDIQDAYQKEVQKRELTSTLASQISMKEEERSVHFMEGYSISEVKTPSYFVGKSIKEVDIRAKYGVDVLSIKSREKGNYRVNVIPNPDYKIKQDDVLVVAGEIGSINVLKNLT